MSRKLALNDTVTEFMLNTCRLCPPLTSKHAAIAAYYCGFVATLPPANEVDPKFIRILLTTGSVAEFYIEPMLPHVGDIDVMFHSDTFLAIPRGHPPPTQLPAEFHNKVQVMEIIDSHLPGYVYLELRYLLTESSDDGNYNAAEYDKEKFIGLLKQRHDSDHGPATVHRPETRNDLTVDDVYCVRCLLWPPQAADWPTRHRNYGWPDSATLDRVASNGCDVVGVAHRQCRQHEWMGKHQWRLSFSRAEIVLINSWMPVQQIVYHMLRYFTKTEILGITDCADNAGADTLSNYHIKTLMLWACELKSKSWWTDDVNLARTCVKLLHNLAAWLTHRRCQHYFINSCNLIDNSFTMTNIRDQLMSIDEKWLSEWFVDNYIPACLQLNKCPPHISRLFDDVISRAKLQNAVSVLVAWKPNSSVYELRLANTRVENTITLDLCIRPLTARCVSWMRELTKTNSCLSVYFTAVVFLHVASRSLRHDFNDELMDILAAVCGQFTDTRRYRNKTTSTSVLSLNIAAKLMKAVANKSLSTMSLIEIELSKAYLYRALRCKDSDSDSIYCLANVYLAVLYYITGQYQKAIDHCTLVTRSQDHSHCSSVVHGEISPKIDDDIDNMLGLAELYQSVRSAALKQQRQPQLVFVFTSELFAHYLHVKYLSVIGCCQFMHTSSMDEFKRYRMCINDSQQLFIGDVLLFFSVSRLLTFQHRAVWLKPQHQLMDTNKYNSSELVELLQKSAVEHMTTHRQLLVRDFGSVVTIVTTDFEALYAYKHGDYQQSLLLSTQNVHTLLYADCLYDFAVLPNVTQLLNDDIVSLTALMIMVNRDRNNNHSRDDGEITQHHNNYHWDDIDITQLIPSLYLMAQCQLKLQHSVTALSRHSTTLKSLRVNTDLTELWTSWH